ncbi:hypothetical protein Spb1_24610 [Planctopirus ephydatiae]|uniref:Uncharacterized protein n=1 Tax=Planctopirus ephydatiae TaxID=2528019 RepID=A0A518GPH9_9PLAN|nr:hypothetical protein Spb1_24610 [Planctopirus ephydatiae]
MPFEAVNDLLPPRQSTGTQALVPWAELLSRRLKVATGRPSAGGLTVCLRQEVLIAGRAVLRVSEDLRRNPTRFGALPLPFYGFTILVEIRVSASITLPRH